MKSVKVTAVGRALRRRCLPLYRNGVGPLVLNLGT
jgi:hypothetical protein